MKPDFPEAEAYNECLDLKPEMIHLSQVSELANFGSIEVFPSRIDVAQAEELAKVKLVKGLTINLYYSVRYPRRTMWRHKILRPSTKEIKIYKTQLVRTPNLPRRPASSIHV